MSQSLQMNGWNVELTISSFLIGLCTGQLFWGPSVITILSPAHIRRYNTVYRWFYGMHFFNNGSQYDSLANYTSFGGKYRACTFKSNGSRSFSGNDRAKVFSNLITIMTLAPLIGPLLGGQIIQYSSWRTIFILLVFIGFITLFLIAKFPESFPKEKRDKTQKKEY